MSTIDQAGKSNQGEIRYLTPLDIATKNKKNIVVLSGQELSILTTKILISY